MRRLTVGAVLAVVTVAATHASPPAPSEASALVAQLGSDDYRTREQAGKALLALGDRALPALRAALKTVADPEAHRRAEALVRRVEAERLVAPRRVTLKAARKPLKDVVAEIAKQSDYPVQYTSVDNPKLTLELADVPFWEAVDRVCVEAGLSAYLNNDESGQVTLSISDTYDPHVAYWGPFRVTATHVGSGRNLPLSGLSRRHPNLRQPEWLSLNFTLFAEPKAPVLALGPAVVTKAVDDTGASMLVPPQPGEQSVSHYPPSAGHRSLSHGFAVSLHRVNQAAATIRELRGKVPAVVLSEVRPEVVVEDVLKVKKKRFTGRTAELEVVSAEFANDGLAMELTVRRLHGDPDDFTWAGGLLQRLEVADAAGAKYTFNGLTNQTAGKNVVTYQMQYTANGKKLGKPARLTLVEWVTVTRDVEFTFKDVPLP